MDWKQNLIDSINQDEQIIFIKFCTLLNHNAQQIEDELIKAIGSKAYSLAAIQRFQNELKERQNRKTNEKIIKNILLKSESNNNIKPKKEKYLNNLLYSDCQKLAKKSMATKNHFEKNYLTILDKILNAHEWNIDETLFELILINSYQTQSSESFWKYANNCIYKKIDLKIVDIHNIYWKFLFLCHWLMRNGHPNVIKDAYGQRSLLVELAKIKTCISPNCCLFQSIESIVFFIEQLGNQDPCVYEKICIELFNYMDKILQLQLEIFDIRGLNIDGAQQKCILNPLKLSIIESSQIYDLIFQLMQKLHNHHHESSFVSENNLKKYQHRFRDQFMQLKLFYSKCQEYDYLNDSIQIPELVDEPPNFGNPSMNDDEFEQQTPVFYPRIVIDEN
ncbi:hypothetical protein HUG17_4274 [Dermatophagoides farinae]|uniref:AP180 N-terminal homology (ANTH) domain-containing protein n=1 Tax=Dermatophagoides farinae TaxID=6954 RepID=A0A9D4SHG4_DERFA|nr:hypothetical protein HUG17_4274 [Dermatophagoides farinae]